MVRVGAVWNTFTRHSSSRRMSSVAPTLKISTPLSRAMSAIDSKLRGRNVGEHVAVALGDHLLEDRNDIGVRLHLGHLEREFLAEEIAGRVVVADRDIRAGNAFVARRNVEHGQRQLRRIGAQIADPDLGDLLLSGFAGCCGLSRVSCAATAAALTLAKKSPMKTARVFGTMLFIAAFSPNAPSSDIKSDTVRCFGAVMTLTRLFSIANPLTLLFAATLAACGGRGFRLCRGKSGCLRVRAAQGSVVPGAPDPHEAEDRRLKMIGERLRDHLASSGLFQIVDIAPVAGKAAAANLQACGNCADDLARALGADYAFTGVRLQGFRIDPEHQRRGARSGDLQASDGRER